MSGLSYIKTGKSIGCKYLTDAELGRTTSSGMTHIGLLEGVFDETYDGAVMVIPFYILGAVSKGTMCLDFIENPDGTRRSPKIRKGRSDEETNENIVRILRSFSDIFRNNRWFMFFSENKTGSPFFVFIVQGSNVWDKAISLGINFDKLDGNVIPGNSSDYATLSAFISSLFEGDIKDSLPNSPKDNVAGIPAKGGYNKIYYGAPGCGKSQYVKKKLIKASVASENIIRVTFHPEYLNTDFIGQIMPTVKKDAEGKDVVKYEFSPGPFALSLLQAYNNLNDMVYLIIEEINRGNAAAIFGDSFQLLDRVKDLEKPDYSYSEYPIRNPSLQDYLVSQVVNEEVKAKLETGIFIPGNLTILATMNSSDQNVFTLDTAFKRRWSFEQISNDISTDNQHTYKNWFVPGTDVTWETFLTKINEKILEIKVQNQTNEDKRLGKYFVTKECLVENNDSEEKTRDRSMSFAYKVLEYIWNDVCKIGREEWFNTERFKTLEDLIEAFVNPKDGETPLSVFGNMF